MSSVVSCIVQVKEEQQYMIMYTIDGVLLTVTYGIGGVAIGSHSRQLTDRSTSILLLDPISTYYTYYACYTCYACHT